MKRLILLVFEDLRDSFAKDIEKYLTFEGINFMSIITPTFTRSFAPAVVLSSLFKRDNFSDYDEIILIAGSVDRQHLLIEPVLENKKIKFFWTSPCGAEEDSKYEFNVNKERERFFYDIVSEKFSERKKIKEFVDIIKDYIRGE